MADRATLDLRDELREPSVIDVQTYRSAARHYRPCVVKLSAQVSRLQELLVEVEEAENAQGVQGKLESFRQSMRALDRMTTTAEKALSALQLATRRVFEEEVPELLATIEEAAE